MKKRFFRVLIALALCSSVFPSAMAADGHVYPHGYHTFGDYTLNETMVQQTGIIGLMLVLSRLVKFLVLYLQLKLGSTHLVQLV